MFATTWSLEYACMFILGCTELIISTGHKSLFGILSNNKYTQLTFTCLKSRTETLEKGVKLVQSSGVYNVNFEHISHLFLVFLFLTLNK